MNEYQLKGLFMIIVAIVLYWLLQKSGHSKAMSVGGAFVFMFLPPIIILPVAFIYYLFKRNKSVEAIHANNYNQQCEKADVETLRDLER